MIVDDVKNVQRFAVATEFADEIEHLLDGPIFVHRNKIRRHQSADAAFRITEERLGDAAFLGREQLD